MAGRGGQKCTLHPTPPSLGLWRASALEAARKSLSVPPQFSPRLQVPFGLTTIVTAQFEPKERSKNDSESKARRHFIISICNQVGGNRSQVNQARRRVPRKEV